MISYKISAKIHELGLITNKMQSNN